MIVAKCFLLSGVSLFDKSLQAWILCGLCVKEKCRLNVGAELIYVKEHDGFRPPESNCWG